MAHFLSNPAGWRTWRQLTVVLVFCVCVVVVFLGGEAFSQQSCRIKDVETADCSILSGWGDGACSQQSCRMEDMEQLIVMLVLGWGGGACPQQFCRTEGMK